MEPVVLEELHRLRDFHAGQLSAFNFSGSVAVVVAAVTILVSDKIPKFTSRLKAIVIIGLVVISSIGLFVAATLHWDHHAGQIRRIDDLLQTEYAAKTTGTPGAVLGEGLANGMGANWNPAYCITGVSIGLLGLAAITVLAMRLWPLRDDRAMNRLEGNPLLASPTPTPPETSPRTPP